MLLGRLSGGDGMRSFMQVLGTRHEWRCMITMGKHAVVRLHPGLHSRQTDLRLLVAVVAVKRLVGSHPDEALFGCSKRLGALLPGYGSNFQSLAAIAACSLRSRLCLGKLVGIKGPASQPDQPHRFQNFALSVEPGVAHTSGA
jgi:hypothetical protein